jgi:hypothetical protein
MVFVKYYSRNGHGVSENTFPAIIVVFFKSKTLKIFVEGVRNTT